MYICSFEIISVDYISRTVIMNKIISLFTVRRALACRFMSNRLTADGKDIPKVKNFADRITLISPDHSVHITDLKNAQNLSARRELKLVKIQDADTKTRRPVYKLMSNAEYHEEELQRRKEKQSNKQTTAKGEKLLTFSTRIGTHDLMTNVKKMTKLLEKQHEVRIVITGEGTEATHKSESMYTLIEKNLKDFGKIVQKRNKGNSLRFQLIPFKEKSTHAGTGSNPSQEDKGNEDSNKGPL